MPKKQPPQSETNQGLGCPLLDVLSHRHFIEDGRHVVELNISDEMRGPGGAVHGGLVAGLIDCAGASAVAQASKRPPATSNLTVSYLAAGRVGPLRAEAEVLRLGQSHGVCNVRVYDNGMDNRLVAMATVTVNFLDGTEFSSKAV
jgi:uncharacterized protein (TIGR00369 family)